MEGKPARQEQPSTMRYVFEFGDGRTTAISLTHDGRPVAPAEPEAADYPPWTALEFQQCPNCPLTPEESPRCPAAVSVMGAIEQFGDIVSHEQADIRIETPARTYSKRTSVQEAVGSLFGLTMASSGCPVLAKLGPMGRYHLPFSSMDETQYRVLSMYLLAQYFKAQAGEAPDWELKDLKGLYEEIRTVNVSFAGRLGGAERKDTNRNAIAILDSFALMVSFSIDRQKMDELKALFAPYLA